MDFMTPGHKEKKIAFAAFYNKQLKDTKCGILIN